MISLHAPDADQNKFRILLPSFQGMGRVKTAYVAHLGMGPGASAPQGRV
jgi:hypothetical protein